MGVADEARVPRLTSGDTDSEPRTSKPTHPGAGNVKQSVCELLANRVFCELLARVVGGRGVRLRVCAASFQQAQPASSITLSSVFAVPVAVQTRPQPRLLWPWKRTSYNTMKVQNRLQDASPLSPPLACPRSVVAHPKHVPTCPCLSCGA